MRLLITAGFLGRFGEIDGAVNTYRNLLPLLERAGLPADVVAYGPRDERADRGTVRFFIHRPRCPLALDRTRRIDVAFAASRLARSLERESYGLVQSSTPDTMGLWARGLARRRHVPFVTIYHTAFAEYAAIRARRAGRIASAAAGACAGAFMRHYLGASQLILAPSQSAREQLEAQLPSEVAVLGRGVDTRLFDPAKRRRRRGRVRALYVGRVTPEKNLDLLVRLFANERDVDLWIVGDGPARASLRARLPHARFLGQRTGEDLAAAYADADFFVFPSRTDTLGNVVLEAMASGLPVVVADSMGPKELVRDGETGFVARSDDDFAAVARRLSTDSVLRSNMGEAARAFALTRAWAAIADLLVGHYQRLLRAVPGTVPRAQEIRHAVARG